jgi:hypothetical protein
MDMPMSGTGAFAKGDAVVFSSGKLTKVTNTVATVSGVVQEARASGSDGGLLQVALATKNQVWRVSADDTTLSATLGARTLDVVDANTLDASDATNGSLVLIDSDTDSDGNVLAYVAFSITTVG